MSTHIIDNNGLLNVCPIILIDQGLTSNMWSFLSIYVYQLTIHIYVWKI